jgi:DNA-binding IscR family transcriptional regulator
MAIHILLCIEFFKETHKATDDFIDVSVKPNPTIIRSIMAPLRDAGIIEIAARMGGAKLIRPSDQITMRNVYSVVNPTKGGKFFKYIGIPNQDVRLVVIF